MSTGFPIPASIGFFNELLSIYIIVSCVTLVLLFELLLVMLLLFVVLSWAILFKVIPFGGQYAMNLGVHIEGLSNVKEEIS